MKKFLLSIISLLCALPLTAQQTEQQNDSWLSFLPEWLELGIDFLLIIFVPLVLIVIFVGMWRKTFSVIWYVISLQPLRRWLKKRKLTKEGSYYRDPPADGNLKVAATVTNAFSPALVTNYNGLFGALFLRLFNKKALRIEHKATMYGTEPHTVLTVADWTPSVAEQQSLEWKFYNMISGAAGIDRVLQPRELQQYMRARGEHFEPFVNSLQKLDDQEKKMAKDPKVATQVFGLKHFLEDFTLIADKQIKELPLWDEYLVYATLFGIADKVCDNFAEVYPDYFSMNSLAGTMLNLVGNNGLTTYANAAAKGLELDSTESEKQKKAKKEKAIKQKIEEEERQAAEARKKTTTPKRTKTSTKKPKAKKDVTEQETV
ncbi:MAG: DUF2207 domain-containing protein [Prevotella sp.]|nr:DUF2207 domain-containing protein [Prevotella sp.]